MFPDHFMAKEEREFLEEPHIVSPTPYVDRLKDLEQDRPGLGKAGHDAKIDVPSRRSPEPGSEEKDSFHTVGKETEVGAKTVF